MNPMRAVRFALWVVLAAGWGAACFAVAASGGGVLWLEHMGLLQPAVLDAIMAALCIVAAVQSLRGAPMPAPLATLIAASALLHVLGYIGIYFRTTPLAILYYWLEAVFPTNIIFIRASRLGDTWAVVAMVVTLALPVATFAAARNNGRNSRRD